jgi:prophage antirepressor-like protein
VTALQVFDFSGRKVRTAGTHEAPLFCAADVCAVLSLGDVAQACGRIDQDDVTLEHHVTAENKQNRVTDGQAIRGVKRSLYVTESGLYALIFGCEKPEAKSFKKWVTSEVLPAIRRQGYYSAVEAAQQRTTKELLAACFPLAPAKAKPIFSDLIAELLKMRNEEHAGNPPWAPLLASIIYELAIPVVGQQAERRARNSRPDGSHVDHAMFAPEVRDHVINCARVGVALAKNSSSWGEWRARMETAFRNAPLQLTLITPVRRLPSGPKKGAA